MAGESIIPIYEQNKLEARLEEINEKIDVSENKEKLCEILENLGNKIVVIEHIPDESDSFSNIIYGNLDSKTGALFIYHNNTLDLIPKVNPNYFINTRKTKLYEKNNQL